MAFIQRRGAKEKLLFGIESLRDIPHRGDTDVAQLMRTQSKAISDQYSKFMDLRVKIHGNPEPEDTEKVRQFSKTNESLLTTDLKAKLNELVKKVRKEEKIAVPVDQIKLDQTSILNMREVNASNSGKICGPKAANLGQLKQMYPEKVVEGLVIPFGIFRDHMDQQMPGQNMSYWAFLNAMFKEAAKKRAVDGYQKTGIRRLKRLQLSIAGDLPDAGLPPEALRSMCAMHSKTRLGAISPVV